MAAGDSKTSNSTALIDGYNVIKRTPVFDRLSLEASRKQLIALLPQVRWPTVVSQVIVVFDAPESSRLSPRAHLHVQYAHPSADAFIREKIQTAAGRSRFIVVSDDREILHTAKIHGSLCFSTAWLMQHAAGKRGGRSGADVDRPEDRPLSAPREREITEELRKRWIKPDEA